MAGWRIKERRERRAGRKCCVVLCCAVVCVHLINFVLISHLCVCGVQQLDPLHLTHTRPRQHRGYAQLGSTYGREEVVEEAEAELGLEKEVVEEVESER